MTRYRATLPTNAQSFAYNGTTYNAGEQFQSDDPCAMLGFYQAYKGANADGGRQNATPNFWQEMERQCPGNGSNAAPPATQTPPSENATPPGTDSPAAQGAPSVDNATPGSDSAAQQPGTGDDSPTSGEPTRPPQGEPDQRHSGERPQTQTNGGDPVDLFTGTVYIDETDVDVPETIPPLTFARTYRSGLGFYGPLGWNWDHNHNLYVRELANGDLALWRSGREDRFTWTGGGFESPRGIFERIDRVTGVPQAFELEGVEGRLTRFERPPGWIDGERVPILWTADRHGNRLVYTYGPDDHLVRVEDDDGRFIDFEYDDCGLLVAVSDHSGRRYVYEHNEEKQHLVCVTKPATSDHPTGTRKRFFYEGGWEPPSLRHNLLRVEDADGNVYLENEYEQDPSSWQYGRVVTQLYGSYLFQYRYTELQWVPPAADNVNIHSVRAEVLNPQFGLETYTFNFRGDLLDRRYRLNEDGSFRVVAWQYEYDGQGNRTVTTKPDGAQEIFTYDFQNPDPRLRWCLLRKELTSASGFPSPSRIVWRGVYEPRYGLLTEETNEVGAMTRRRYDFDVTPGDPANSGKLKEIVQPGVTLPDGTIQTATTAFEHNLTGRAVAMVLPDGVRNEMRYGTAGEDLGRLVEEISDVGGLAITRQRRRGAHGYVSELVDGNGEVTRLTYNALGQLERVERPVVAGSTDEQRYHYDSDGYVVGVERPKGGYAGALTDGAAMHIIDLIERDVLGYPTRSVLAWNTSEGREIRFENDYRGIPLKTTVPDGSVIKQRYDERRLPLSEEVEGHDGLVIRSGKVYDRTGRLIRQTDVQGSVWIYEYDGFGRPASVTLPNGSRRRYTWRAGDLLDTEEVVGDDGTGTVRRLARYRHDYDEKNRRVSTVQETFTDDPAVFTDVTTLFFYDELDRVTKIVNSRGGETIRQYDGLGRSVAEIDPMGHEEHIGYDANGNVVRRTSVQSEPNGTVTTITRTFTFDARDRRTAVVEPDGASEATVYDDRDLVVEHTDRLGVVTRNEYDAFNSKVREVEDVGGLAITHQWTIDNMSRTTAYTDPTGEVTTYAFDSVGRLQRTKQPNGFATTRAYDAQNRLVSETLDSGVRFTYTFDAANRVTAIENTATPAGVIPLPIHTFAYDGRDRLTRATEGGEDVVRSYDSHGRITSETALANTMACRYDDATGEVEKIWPDGRREVLVHDLNGVLTTVTQTANGALGTGGGLLAAFRTSGPGAIGDAAYRGGITVSNSYDERKRLVEIRASSPTGFDQRLRYRYDTGGRRRVEAFDGTTSSNSFFDFDARSRLVAVRDGFAALFPFAASQSDHDAAIAAAQTASAGAPHAETFVYDDADARLTHAETGVPPTNYIYAAGHRVQSDGTTAFAFHPDGTMRSAGATDLDVDALGRVVAVRSGPTTLLQVEYDALGRPRLLRQPGEPDRSFHYLGAFVEQENDNGTPARQITLHPVTGVPIAYHSAAGTHYALVDARFNLVALVDDAGALAETYQYRAFGEPTITDPGSATLAASAFGVQPVFGGQRYLAGPGLYLSRHRLMDPRHGLFIAPDPRPYVDSPSLYAYAAQDPINKVDPNGDVIPFIVAAFVIGGALVGAGYSAYDAYHNPNKYEGFSGSLRVLGNVFGGAIIGGAAVVAGEGVLALGGTGIFATGTATTTLTASQAFVLYGTSSMASGSVLRYGFNGLFPEYVDPVSPRTMAFDYATGGGMGAALRTLAPVVSSGGSRLTQQSWLRYGRDLGGETEIIGELGPYPGRIGQLLDRIGIRQGYQSTVTNLDAQAGASWFARTDTAAHEGFHVFVGRYFPTFRNLSLGNQIWSAAARYPEEVVAYAVGRAAALRFHAVPLAPMHAFNSLNMYSPAEQAFARWFWGIVWAGGAAAGLGVGVAHAETPPNEKPAASK